MNPEIDALCISTPVNSHFGLAKLALEHGKHVFIEKPITSTSSEAIELIKIAEKNNKLLMTGHVFEYNPAINTLKTIIDNGDLGEILYFSIERTNLGPVRTDVNALWDLTTHDISVLIKLIGRAPNSVSVNGESYLNHNLEDVVFARLDFGDKLFAQVHASWLNPKKRGKCVLSATKKWLYGMT